MVRAKDVVNVPQYALFKTRIGTAAIAWSDAGILHTRLPEVDTKTCEGRVKKQFPTARKTKPPRSIQQVISQIQKHLAGRPQNYQKVPIDLSGVPPFHAKVYEQARNIPKGQIRSYAELAAKAGSPQASRAVGQAMAKNPWVLLVPCHRVVAQQGAGGFSAFGGVETKALLLKFEGAALPFPSDFQKLPRSPHRAIATLKKSDPKLKALVQKVGPYSIRPRFGNQIVETLARSIIYQQLAGKAAATIYGRFAEGYGLHPMSPENPYVQLNKEKVLEATTDDLRKVGLSRTKALSIQDLCRKSEEGVLPNQKDIEHLSNQQIVDILTQVRGIGPWTVQMYLMFNLGRADVLPSTDYGVQKGFQKTYGLKNPPKPQDLVDFAEKWRPYRTVASWYLWRALDL